MCYTALNLVKLEIDRMAIDDTYGIHFLRSILKMNFTNMFTYIYIVHPFKKTGGPETVLVKATCSKKNSFFAIAKQTFLQAELWRIWQNSRFVWVLD